MENSFLTRVWIKERGWADGTALPAAVESPL